MSAIQTKNRFVPIILSAAVFLILVVTLLFTNVFRKPETIRSVEIQDHDWEFVLMMEQENVVACRENDMASYSSATPFDMQLRVSDDMITLTNEDTGEQQNITYKILQKNPDGIIYDISCNGKTGYANTGVTTYADGTTENTLYLTMDDVTIKFMEKSGGNRTDFSTT